MTTAFVLSVAGVTLALLALLIMPLMRRPELAPRQSFDLAVYHDQLAELERDLATNLIGEAEAAAARLEIHRRILAAADQDGDLPTSTPGERRFGLALVLIVALPTFAAGVYLTLGQPGFAGRPLVAERVAPEAPDPEIDRLVTALRDRLERAPNDVRGWTLLGRTELNRDRPEAAVDALRRAYALDPEAPALRAQLGEALVRAAQGLVTPEAGGLFREALRQEPGAPSARYYLGLERAQAGDLNAAIELWLALLRDSPSDAAWRPLVEDGVRNAARELNQDPEQLLAQVPGMPPAGGPSSEEGERLRSMAPEQQAEAIRGMVDGLEARLQAEPDDVEGWLRLAQARGVLGEPERARAALDRALELAPEDPDVLRAVIIGRLGPPDAATGEPAVDAPTADLARRWTNVAPEDAEPWWIVGLHELQAGRREQAVAAWRESLNRLPPDAPERPALEGRLAEITS